MVGMRSRSIEKWRGIKKERERGERGKRRRYLHP